MPEISKSDVKPPVSQQKSPDTGTTSTSANKTADPNAPKMESTGAVKTPTGQTVKASESVNKATEKSGVVTGERTSSATSNEPFEKSFSSIKGEILQGDSFRITLQRGNRTIRIPVPIQGSDNIVVLKNTFKLIEEMLATPTEKELDEKFHSFVE